MQQVLMCKTGWRHYNDDFIISNLIGQKVLNDWNVGTMSSIDVFTQIWTLLVQYGNAFWKITHFEKKFKVR